MSFDNIHEGDQPTLFLSCSPRKKDLPIFSNLTRLSCEKMTTQLLTNDLNILLNKDVRKMSESGTSMFVLLIVDSILGFVKYSSLVNCD